MKIIYLLSFCLVSISVYPQTQSLPYAVDFDSGLPSFWSSSNFWKPTLHGVQNSGGMVAKDHVAIIATSELVTPFVDLSGTAHPILQFSLTMGRFPDGQSNFTVHADYGNGWVPIFGSSSDTLFGFSIYPNVYKVKTPENIYSITDTASWIPNPQVPYQEFILKLDSLKEKTAIRFKFLAYFYYGGVVYLDNIKLENQLISEIETPNLKNKPGFYFRKADTNEIEIDLDGPVSDVQLFNANGQGIFCFPELSRKIKIPSSSLPKGIYLINYKLPNAGGVVVRKLILD